MGCAPSRPSESFYQEFVVDRANKNAKAKKAAVEEDTQSKQSITKTEDVTPTTEATKHSPIDEARQLTYEEQIARADLRIYQAEMLVRQAEEDHSVYLMHRADNGRGEWVF